MRKPKTYSLKEVYDSTLLGFVFEFYCSKEASFIVEDLKKISTKNIVITDNANIKPTYTSAILLKEFNGRRPRYQFKIGEQPYNEIPTFLNTILFWINENASLDKSTLLKVKLDFGRDLQTLTNISNMDLGKMILKIDEDFIYEKFPEMKNCPFSLSVKKIIPFNMSSNASNVVNINTNFKMPINEFYGVDLTEQTRGELKFNYIGGEKYSEKVKEIYEILEYYIVTTYQILNSDEYTPSMINELNKLTEDYRTFRRCYYKFDKFANTYKDIKIFIDLKDNPALIETQWFQIRDIIGQLILESGIKKCKFNWDTEFGTYQIKDVEIKNSYIKNLHIVDSKVSGIIEHCHLWNVKVDNSRIFNSTLVNNNKINESYLNRVRADKENKIQKSFIDNNGEIINCVLEDTIIRNAGIGNKAKLDENCVVINQRENLTNPSLNGIEVKEVRDYKWIKTLRREDYKDLGFGNEYKEEE